MFAALLAAIGTYLLVNAVGETIIERVYMSEKAQNERNLATVSSFQTYAREFDLSSRDTEYISRWAISQDDTYILLYKDRRLALEAGWWGIDDGTNENMQSLDDLYDVMTYPVYLRDGVFQAVVYDFSESRLYDAVQLGAVAMGCVVFAIFMLISRTFATYGIEYIKPAVIYMVVTVVLLLLYLFVGYPLYVYAGTRLNPITFLRKIMQVILFGFSTSSSAATLPLNYDTAVKRLGVDKQVASFVLPLGMTINMDGTAIMQVIATLFIAGAAGYDVTIGSLIVIACLALIASIGTPAAPGAGAVILFTILSGVGFTNDAALMAYTLILAINRPIEMLVTSLNCVGDSTACLFVAKSEKLLNEKTYNAK